MSKSLVFYYDVVCPFAYMASWLVEGLGRRTGATVHWRPVLLGGLYEATAAPQTKAGSATQVMSAAKLHLTGHDLRRQMYRLGVPYREPNHNPQRTVYAMRILAGVEDNSVRASLSHALYRAYWYEDRDVGDHAVLEEVAAPFGVSASELIQSDEASRRLRANTAEAAARGAFGVPGFYVGGRLYWGTDRMFLVERALGLSTAAPERLLQAPDRGAGHLTFFFDFSSPWSYLGCMRMGELLASVAPLQVAVEWVPVLLGALFKEIGTPVVPLQTLIKAKVQYMREDLSDWSEYAGVRLQWNSTFPLRTVLPLRVTLASQCNPAVIRALFKAAWCDNRDIGQEEVVREVLREEGEDEDRLVRLAGTEPVKKQLFANTRRAVDEGLCGVPSYRANGGPVVWGQDKMNVVADMLCGWRDPLAKL